jgi:beta-aspartyl-peptidase (threonine type)
LEDNPLFNAGKGAVFARDGTHELDASIMIGTPTKRCGAVSCVKNVKNPITLARCVMEKTEHIYMTSEGASKFAEEMGLELVPNDYFSTERRREQLEAAKKMGQIQIENDAKGTVGCVALDSHGNLCAGTSTGGLTNKRPGRGEGKQRRENKNVSQLQFFSFSV